MFRWENTDIARASKRKRELTFNTDFGDLTLLVAGSEWGCITVHYSLLQRRRGKFAAAAVLAFPLFSFHKALSGWIAGTGGAVGSLCNGRRVGFLR